MNEEEKDQTEKRKREGSRKGRQYVSNTGDAKQARKNAAAPPLRDYDALSIGEIEKKIQGLSKQEISTLRAYEKQHKNRKTLIEALDRKV